MTGNLNKFICRLLGSAKGNLKKCEFEDQKLVCVLKFRSFQVCCMSAAAMPDLVKMSIAAATSVGAQAAAACAFLLTLVGVFLATNVCVDIQGCCMAAAALLLLDTMSIAAATSIGAQAAAAFALLLTLVGVYFAPDFCVDIQVCCMSAAALLYMDTMSIAAATSSVAQAAAAFAWFLTLVGVDFGNAVLFLGFPGILVCGLVLGLRIKGMPARLLDLLKFDLAYSDGATLALATTTVGPRFACRAQATPRVDVDVARRCAPLPVLQVPGTHEHPAKTSGRFQVFVKGFDGHTLVIAGCSDDLLVDDFLELVAMRAQVPVACFYLVGAGSKALRFLMTLSQAGVVGHSLLFMAGRLRGGSSRPRPPPVPGSWHCCVCDMGGCWPARNTCFRCLAPRGTCLSYNPALSLRVKINFRGVLHSQVEMVTRRTANLLHRLPRCLPRMDDLLLL